MLPLAAVTTLFALACQTSGDGVMVPFVLISLVSLPLRADLGLPGRGGTSDPGSTLHHEIHTDVSPQYEPPARGGARDPGRRRDRP